MGFHYSYISNQKQYVEFNDTNSDMMTLTTGVPWGSILGPSLFIIYINDIANAGSVFNFIIDADDTTLFTTLEIVYKNTQDLLIDDIVNTELERVNDWLKFNNLSLNVNKCK